MAQDELTAVNGWALYAFDLFHERLEELVAAAEQIENDDPDGFPSHPIVKLLVCVNKAIRNSVPSDPSHTDFRQGLTLGRGMSHWCRVKRLLPQRYRLFFQYRSNAPKIIIYAWLNDEATLRKAGAKSDCYAVFRAMVSRGLIPNSFEDLRKASSSLPSAS
ncbi:hypothetical protein XarbCFBP7604_09885 [Xanthomonas arboricola]|uniref:type II toxin-antitoxin system YhaV family toxin n=1 Tax=Xanthomonas arboricola TaxID=56448 RepID=UPI000CEE6096|nr:type II toxin-antitoxin system YhaV family toxin [Xanthomonas arboricola]PPU34147.1 hypothetical protein XarbCFBP7604_09885 [Xanthomonas arboricola]